MHWYLVISMIGSDDLLVKQMESKEECVKVQKEFLAKVAKKVKNFEDISCEEGELMDKIDTGVKKDEVL